MPLLQVVVAEATTNVVTNPSVETNTTGWAAVGTGVTIARTTTAQAFGAYSCLVTPNNAIGNGVAVGSYTLTVATAYTFSAWVKGVAATAYKIQLYDATAASEIGSTAFTATGRWERQVVSGTTHASNTAYQVRVVTTVTSTGVFYVDGVQIEQKAAYSTTYVDGDQLGCEWTGTIHASTSTRDARSREGGRVYALGDATLKITEVHGGGMPPIDILTQDSPLLPGSIYQRTKVQSRILTVIFTAASKVSDDYHAARRTLISYLKPDELS